MTDHTNGLTQDRRADVRLASDKKIDAVVVDQYEQPVLVLGDAQVVNVSAGGLMLVSDKPADRGTRIVVNVNDAQGWDRGRQQLELEAVACSPCRDHQHEIRCKLVEGTMPARLIYHW